MYQLNPEAKHSYSYIGDEKTPIYVIDNLLVSPGKFIDKAEQYADFKPGADKGYPGSRAELDSQYTQTVMYAIESNMRHIFSVPSYLKFTALNSFYSMVNRPESELSHFQCIPHKDSDSPYYFAIMHYINEGDFGGTGFYRHKPTGFENIHAQRTSLYQQAVQSYLDKNGYPEQKYFKESDEHFELMGTVDYKPNRLVIYPGTLLHSGIIVPERDISSDMRTSRFTANIFAEFI